MIRKKRSIIELKKDDIVNDIFVVKFKKPVEPYKNGYKFELRLGDSSKEIMYKYWGSSDETKVKMLYEMIEKDDVVLVQGRVNEWNNNLEISAGDQHTIKILKNGEFNVMDFIRKSEKDPDQMWKLFQEFLDSVKDPDMKKILDYFFKDEEFCSDFKESPAAMYIHHGWISGLLEHTLEVVQICDFVCSMNKELDRDLTITGAILHDIGKIEEFKVTTSITVSTEGMLVGHVTIGADKLLKAMDKLGTPENLRLKLIHILLTHMGEYGSNKLPSFPEALLVYHADYMNGDLIHMLNLMKESNTEDDYIYNKDFGNIYLR